VFISDTLIVGRTANLYEHARIEAMDAPTIYRRAQLQREADEIFRGGNHERDCTRRRTDRHRRKRVGRFVDRDLVGTAMVIPTRFAGLFWIGYLLLVVVLVFALWRWLV
jgi:hypothetical protein